MIAVKDTLPKIFKNTCLTHPEFAALKVKDEAGNFQDVSYKTLFEDVKALGTGLHHIGIQRGEHVGIISDNRPQWIATDLALLGLGAIDVPRGSDSTADEIAYILKHADCRVVFAENRAQLEKIAGHVKELDHLKEIVVYDMTGVDPKKAGGLSVHSYEEILSDGREQLKSEATFFEEELEKGSGNDVATLIYTSGTTGEPKGVILTHRNFTFQLERIFDHIGIKAGHTMLSVLPVWHSFERIVEYVLITIGAAIAYSKPVGSIMIADMGKVNPEWMSSVPRIWEGVHNAVYRSIRSGSKVKGLLFHFFVGATELYYGFYNKLIGRSAEFIKAVRWLDILVSALPTLLLWPLKALGAILVFGKIQGRLGNSFIAGISGGGALPPHVDKFFQAAGILLLEGYGLTETAPILAVRKQKHPVMGTVGPLLKDVEHRVLDKESNLVEPGRKGVLYVKSEQVMQGYYKRPEATEEVLKDGWLNTGDIVIFTHKGEFTIIGREKETIVLTGGENIEPVPIEDKLKEHELIDNVMIVGQDQKFLGALVIPNEEAIKAFASERTIDWVDYVDLVKNPEVHEYVNSAVQAQVNTQTGFKHFERIFRFALLPKEFEVGRELTQTMKFKRKVVEKLYRKEIKDIFS